MFSENALQLDYAFSLPLQLSDTSGSHRLSLTFRYSLPKKKVSRGELTRPKKVVADSSAEKIDINTADKDALHDAGFTWAQARSIVNYREIKKFTKIDDLLKLRRITSTKLKQIKGKLMVK